MKFCSNCGNEVNDNAVVCVKCGCSVNASLENDKRKTKRLYMLSCISIFFIIEALAYTILGAIDDCDYALAAFFGAIVVVGLEGAHSIIIFNNKVEKIEKTICISILLSSIVISIISLCVYGA